MIEELTPYITKFRKQKMRLRAIFLQLRKLQKFDGLSDFILFNSIIETLGELNLPYSKKEVYSAFKKVSKDDYAPQEKRALFKILLKRARERSVF